MQRRKSKRTRRVSRPRRKKTYGEVMELKGDEYRSSDEHEGIAFEIYNTMEDQLVSFKELVEKFYLIHLNQSTAYWGKKKPRRETVQPVLFRLMEDPHAPVIEKYWAVIFRANFFVNIHVGNSKHGPHRAELWFKSFTTKKAYWIATLQIGEVFFYNEDKMKSELMHCIEEREWFYTSGEANQSILP